MDAERSDPAFLPFRDGDPPNLEAERNSFPFLTSSSSFVSPKDRQTHSILLSRSTLWEPLWNLYGTGTQRNSAMRRDFHSWIQEEERESRGPGTNWNAAQFDMRRPICISISHIWIVEMGTRGVNFGRSLAEKNMYNLLTSEQLQILEAIEAMSMIKTTSEHWTMSRERW